VRLDCRKGCGEKKKTDHWRVHEIDGVGLWFIDDVSYVTCPLAIDYEKIITEEATTKGL